MNKFPAIVILFSKKWDKLYPFSIIMLSGASPQTHSAGCALTQPLMKSNLSIKGILPDGAAAFVISKAEKYNEMWHENALPPGRILIGVPCEAAAARSQGAENGAGEIPLPHGRMKYRQRKRDYQESMLRNSSI